MNSALTYRPEIDGLRTVAVVPVILFHAGFSVFSGGFVGVDVFFVISGYLITTIILREVAEGRFSILQFYERRARRILPALFTVVLVCVPFAFAWMLPGQFKEFGRSVVSVAMFASNILFWRESGYFAAAAEEKPLLHTWSLAVEEQYYIFFPLAVLLLWRFGRRAVVAGILLTALFSLGLSEWAWRHQPNANFYLLPTRAWELLAGSLLAAWTGRRPTGLWAEVGGALGVVLIVGAILSFDQSTPFPSLWALLPVSGAGLVILCAGRTTWAGRVLAWRPMVAIGLISYSAYLWHQPLFAFARLRSIGTPGPLLMGGLALLALVLAWVTWRFVERPFRDRTRVSRKAIFVGTLAGTIAMGAIAVVTETTKGMPQRLDPEVLRMAAASKPYNPRLPSCTPRTSDELNYCVFNPDLSHRVALWGDSHAMALAGELAIAMAQKNYGLINLSNAGCLPIEGVISEGREHCLVINRQALELLANTRNAQTILIAARWAPPFTGSLFDNTEGGREPTKAFRYIAPDRSMQTLTSDQVGAEIVATVQTLLAAGKTIVLIGPVPEVGWHVPDTLAKLVFFDEELARPLSTASAVFRRRTAGVTKAFAALPTSPRLIHIEPSKLFCDRQLPGRCIAEWDGQALYRDDDHLNASGASWVAAQIANRLNDLHLLRDKTP
tara:strand:+ start:397 stop:2400 length:2004 start_codon:yes stop_codon:yes gene_type:complete